MPATRATFYPEQALSDRAHSLLLVITGSTIVATLHVYCWDECWQIVEDMLGARGYRVDGTWSPVPGSNAWVAPIQVLSTRKNGSSR